MRALPRTGRVALVPTMGAFHEGHLQLMRRARAAADQVVVSLFVNPLQFGPTEDLSRYPRPFDRDTRLAEVEGADVLFAPDANEMYRSNPTVVRVAEVAETYEGARRPGHFEGVATIVLKLFNIVRPDVAVFGLKDLQQCVVVRRMVEDLDVPVSLLFEETVRESDGLAMSSRNAYLSPAERALAPRIYEELSRCRDLVRSFPDEEKLHVRELEASRVRLTELGFEIDYLDLVDVNRMRPAASSEAERAIVMAARIGNTRLIDNVRI
jgi:pantoate--beta-alanine ligase